jgi:hypothetical protein
MSEPQSPPPPGSMIVFDAARAPLPTGAYRLEARTEVSFDGTTRPLVGEQRFDIDAPRFALGPHDIVGTVPPPNAEGAFEDLLPQVMLRRRTLPWERTVDPSGLLGAVPRTPADPPALGTPPWLALLVLEESECTILRNQPVADVVPAAVLARLAPAPGSRCDAVEARRELIEAIMPSLEELAMLGHVRWVDVADRDLAGTDDDGWLAVVVANRLPARGATSVACLVSLEQRTDVVRATPPGNGLFDPVFADELVVLDGPRSHAPSHGLVDFADLVAVDPSFTPAPPPTHVRLVLLHAWRFTCIGTGAFADLVGALDVGMLGQVATAGQPTVTDTGHVPITLHTREGVTEQALYRGPLVPQPLTRDPLGPYHSADQARRVAPETGTEDIGYAAAFELGRLLAASDPRFAQELAEWRRAAYQRSSHRDALIDVLARVDVPTTWHAHIEAAPAAVAASGVLRHIATHAPVRADRRELRAAARAPGLQPKALVGAWGLESEAVARELLAGDGLQPRARAMVGIGDPGDPVLAHDDEVERSRIAAARDAIATSRVPTEDPR